ncbi:TetR/AcrR family transcriptional regulator [Micromonospora sp. WMMD1082]|uniref:TetR/AcrR family transcriptional regulator n=1 Tax=Micromonospora sp. WMMD1082 TaxID=3016104 RepID=UPI0024160396|nr:TetR/AcrR family transcriptional regulator [Micromonospora sp. WMMD1082]MDG4796675.1 TetR/AcrR family transcriptional regulator [Micromonospora sp. WMMD1082]
MGRGRRPAGEVRRDVLAAAGRVLREQGMAGFTVEKVAAASGASKVTIYKMWPSKGTLAMEGYFASVEQALSFPDTGDIEADLRTQLHAFVDVLTGDGTGRVVAELIGAAQTDRALHEAYLSAYSRPRRDLAVARLQTAIDAGQLRYGLDCESVVDQLWGACYHRLLLPDEPLDHRFVDTLVDNLFHGIGA